MIKFLFLIFFVFAQIFSQEQTQEEPSSEKPKRKLIILSIDGFPGYYQDQKSEFYDLTPNLNELISKSTFSNTVFPIHPTSTYPSHTSMITGKYSSEHGILFNGYVDPFGKYRGAWNWFSEDIKSKTILDFASSADLKTASVYWPVSVGFDIDYNIPQYWKLKNDDDEKLIRALSTRFLYDDIKNEIKHPVTEISGDVSRFRAGAAVWNLKKPDIMLLYTTDLDTAHHSSGAYSSNAKYTLMKIDKLLGEFISKIKLYKSTDTGLIIVSDHGFKKVTHLCGISNIMKKLKYIDTKRNRWKYTFKSTGGAAYLVENPKETQKFPALNLSKIKSEIERTCPNAKFDYKDKYYKQVKKFHSNKILGVAYSWQNIAFIDSLSYKGLFTGLGKKGEYYQHGFLPYDSDMKTIGLFYPASFNKRIEKLTDVFQVGCEWLGIKCK